MKTLIASLLLFLFVSGSSEAQTIYQSGLVKAEITGSDTATVRDTLSRRINTTSNTLKDLFKTAYRVVHITSANKLTISSDPLFADRSTVTLDSTTNYYDYTLFATNWRSVINYPNIYIKGTNKTTVTYFYRIEGY